MDAVGNVERALLAQLKAGLTAESSPLIARVLRNNQIMLHNYRAPSMKDCRCDLTGCGAGFSIILIPNQTIYPRFCAAHRSEHRRALHREQMAAATLNIPSP
jgi:ethanolamine ammonia-lyase large subunit